MTTRWEPVIGLEVHTQLATHSKIFSGASCAYGAEPNMQACNIDLALPGVLPVLNAEAVTLAIRFGLSISAEIASSSVFARKNYFYPDLPKGYQISQYDQPIVGRGHLDITLDNGDTKRIGITRAHLEEDAGKSLHDVLPHASCIDLNRAGTPLLEIVSEPDLRSPEEAVAYLKTIHTLVRYLGISDANMQEGSFRCDVNISLRRQGDTQFGTRAEIKNVNSFRFVDKAIRYEIERQTDLLNAGGTVIQETRQFDANKNITRGMRGKEAAHDYRYFPDPDLLPVVITTEMIDRVRDTLPELPWVKKERFKHDYQLSEYDAHFIALSLETAQYFEAAIAHASPKLAKLLANWMMGELAAALNKAQRDITESPVQPQQLAQLVQRIEDGTLSSSMAKTVFECLWSGTDTNVDNIIADQGLSQISDANELLAIIDDIISNNPTQVEQYRAGKDRLFGFFVGQVMKATRGKANPTQVNELLHQRLQKD